MGESPKGRSGKGSCKSNPDRACLRRGKDDDHPTRVNDDHAYKSQQKMSLCQRTNCPGSARVQGLAKCPPACPSVDECKPCPVLSGVGTSFDAGFGKSSARTSCSLTNCPAFPGSGGLGRNTNGVNTSFGMRPGSGMGRSNKSGGTIGGGDSSRRIGFGLGGGGGGGGGGGYGDDYDDDGYDPDHKWWMCFLDSNSYAYKLMSSVIVFVAMCKIARECMYMLVPMKEYEPKIWD